MMIIGNSSAKQHLNDGKVMLNDGRIVKVIISGTKDKCMDYWSKQKAMSNTAPYRRQTSSMNRSHSPDSIFSGIHLASSKRLASENRSNPSTKRPVDHSSFPQNSSQKNNQDLDRYRDSDSKEIFHDEITDEGRNLLEVSARNAGEYARNLLKILFKPHELQSKIFEGRIRFGTN
ncbi:unnamed protein product [Didymodactylos carnosus]|uniref:Uncharacterized protein n=1 Tax=Didymodactylos carnosus TaxID=1234261 RepID=A0A814YIC3_9BILA|nr:unnamed protein product [Didymodactylos carnosus]CAF3993738.1 unnamed protein product [Didymodactylos carnosus]